MDKQFEEICFSLKLRSADRVLTQYYNECLAPEGIRATQFAVIRALKALKESNANQLIDILVLEQASLSRLLKLLVRDGLVKELPGVDGREKRISLTTEGELLYGRASKRWQVAQKQLQKHLGSNHSAELLELCDRVIAFKK